MPETFCTLLCLINYRSVIIVVVMVTGYSTNILRILSLYYCKRSGLTFSMDGPDCPMSTKIL